MALHCKSMRGRVRYIVPAIGLLPERAAMKNITTRLPVRPQSATLMQQASAALPYDRALKTRWE